MGAAAQRWVGTVPNPPITGDHVQQVLGNDTVQQVASQLGVPPTQAASGLAALLPTVIDRLTPKGQSVSGPELQDNIAGLLKGGTGSLGLGDLAKLFARRDGALAYTMRTLVFGWWMAVLAYGSLSSHAAHLTGRPSVEFTDSTRAVIRWSTDVSTGSRVFFGESVGGMTRRAEGEQGVRHCAVLPALEPGTKWFFTVGTARVPLATNSFIVPGIDTREQAPPEASKATSEPRKTESAEKAPPTRETWGYLPSLPDHFERHGHDFNAKDADEYARRAWEFRQRAKTEGLPTKVDSEGVTRIYDPKSGAFAAYNRNGTTKTFFKPNTRDYFDRQPGDLVRPKKRN